MSTLLTAEQARAFTAAERGRVPAMETIENVLAFIRRQAEMGHDDAVTWSIPRWHVKPVLAKLTELGYRAERVNVLTNQSDELLVRWDNAETPF